MRVFIFGAGKVGAGLARAIRKAGWQATLRPARKGLPKRAILADLVVFAVRDRDLSPLAVAVAASGLISRRAACVHVAGALGPEALASLRKVTAGVGQMHPMISFASATFSPSLARGNLHVQGDRVAVARARALGRRLGMTPRTIDALDTVGYHAAAGLLANGAGALAAVASDLLVRSGVRREDAPLMLGPLLRSVAENVETLGFPGSLTGPVRRGEAESVARHLAVLKQRAPEAVPLFIQAARAQLPLARALSDAPPSAFVAVESVLDDHRS